MPPGGRDPRALRPGRRATVLLLGLLPALVAYGCWRLERDHPLWLRPGLWSVPRARAASPALPRLVLAFHYPWYGIPGGPAGRWRHWNHARLALPAGTILGFHEPWRESAPGRLDLGATHYPARGPYDSRDPAVIRDQIRAAQAAGLDGFVVSWWGRASEEARTFGALLAVARDTGFRVAPYYETGELWIGGAAQVAADLDALLARHGREAAWLTVNGAPVVFLYGTHRLRPAAWDYVRRRLQASGRPVFLVGDSARPGWLDALDALHVYTPVTFLARGRDLTRVYRDWAATARAAGLPFLPAVAPGFDDRVIRQPGTVVDRRGGATYDATWRAALAVDPPWVLVASWNEWHEGSEIEASREHGTRYLEATRAWVELFRARPRPTSPGAAAPGSESGPATGGTR